MKSGREVVLYNQKWHLQILKYKDIKWYYIISTSKLKAFHRIPCHLKHEVLIHSGFLVCFKQLSFCGALTIWRRKWQPTPVFLHGESQERRSLVGYSPWGRKESDTTEQLHSTISANFKSEYIYGGCLFFLIFRVESWEGVWESWTIQLVCLQNDDTVLKMLENTVGREASCCSANRWDQPIRSQCSDSGWQRKASKTMAESAG